MKYENLNQFLRSNPFVLFGTCSNAKIKERNSHITKINAFTKVLKPVYFPLDTAFAPNPISRTTEIIDQANSYINLNQDFLLHSLFWFIKITAIDEKIIKFVEENNIDAAFPLLKLNKNFSSFINLSVLYALQNNLSQSLEAILELFNQNSDNFEKFIDYENEFLGASFDHSIRQSLFSNYINQIESIYTIDEIHKSISTIKESNPNLDYSLIDQIINSSLLAKPYQEIETLISNHESPNDKSIDQIYELGINFYKKCEEHINYIKSLTNDPISDPEYDLLTKKISDVLREY